MEDLLKLTRRIRELWMIGTLRQPESIDSNAKITGQDTDMLQNVMEFENLANKIFQHKYHTFVCSIGCELHEDMESLEGVDNVGI